MTAVDSGSISEHDKVPQYVLRGLVVDVLDLSHEQRNGVVA